MRWALVLAVWGVVAGIGVVAYFAYDLPNLDDVAGMTRRPSVTVLAADGTPVAAFGQLYGDVIPVEEMPAYLPGAVMAVEDRRFHDHWGVDPLGIARAAVTNLVRGRVVQGGSTITQQTAKNLFLSNERNLKRKVQEVLLAVWLETRFTKNQILTLYLNRVYLGAGTYGVEAAAQRYFGRSAREVSVYQAAMLAGLLKAPSRYNPLADAAAAEARTAVVLRAMIDAGMLTEEQAASARSSSGQAVAGVRRAGVGRHFADWVMETVEDYVSLDRDVVVRTTLDMRLQTAAESVLAATLREAGPKAGASEGAVVVLAPDGAVRAMAGGRDYAASQYNRAVQAQRQPGSAFKPIVFLAALEAGIRPDDRVLDAPITIGNWSPTNFDGTFRGEVTFREVAARSLNTPTVRLQERVGRSKVIAAARRVGLEGDLPATASLALGTEEMSLLPLTAAYAPFGNGGTLALPHGIVEISDREGTVLYRRAGSGGGRVIEPHIAGAMNDLLGAVTAWGTGKAAALDRPAAGKTGTSQSNRDAWFIGYTADMVAGVWVGNDDDTPMKGVTGGGLPARIWKQVMTEAHRGLPPRPLPTARDEDTGLSRLFREIFGSGDSSGGGSSSGSGGASQGGAAPARQDEPQGRWAPRAPSILDQKDPRTEP
ncbi:transglycosylase domain-containing protein [Novispirillum sp. DQ9]|uniref:transglycosylase domain-containing protein n=1 Tax=Novispirillum sp. DQ9 TaxID=3398612 RepID=UPI003C7BDA30